MADSRDQKSFVRYPRFKVTANGTEIRFNQVEIVQNGHHEADSFDIQAPLFDPKGGHDWVWWAHEVDIEIEISAGFADEKGTVGSWTSLIIGPVDAIAQAPVAFGPHSTVAMRGRTEIGRGGMMPNEDSPPHPFGAVLQIRGRDYSGQLIDSEMSDQQLSGNLTSKDVFDRAVESLEGVSLDLSDVPSDAVGDLMQNVQGRLNLHRSAWDVVTAAADHEGLRATMKGKRLKIAPRPTEGSGSVFEIFYEPATGKDKDFHPARSNCMTLRMSRALSVGRGIDRFVHSYDAQVGRRPNRYVAQARGSGSKRKALAYTDNVPGMTDEQVKKHATAKANQVAKFERDLEFQIPGDLSLTLDSQVRLTGTGTDFDQTYEVNQLTHFYDLTQGYRMEVRCRNRSKGVSVKVSKVNKGQDPKPAVNLPEVPHYTDFGTVPSSDTTNTFVG